MHDLRLDLDSKTRPVTSNRISFIYKNQSHNHNISADSLDFLEESSGGVLTVMKTQTAEEE